MAALAPPLGGALDETGKAETSQHGAPEEDHRLAPGEALHGLHEIIQITGAYGAGDVLEPIGGLADEPRRHALAALVEVRGRGAERIGEAAQPLRRRFFCSLAAERARSLTFSATSRRRRAPGP